VSWPLVPISEIAKVVTGKTPSKMDDDNFGGDIPFVTPAELGKLIYVKDAPQTLSAKGAATIKLIPKDAVMVCCIGSLGKLAIAGRELATNQQINSVIFDEKKIDPKFGFYALSRLKPQMESLAPSTTIAIINKSNFEALKIPLPPLAEQKRIAALLDKADAIRRKRQQAIQLADEFLRSVFLDMFGDPVTNPKGWEVGSLSEYGSFKNGLNFGKDEHEFNVRYLGVGDFKSRTKIEGVESLTCINLSSLPSDEYYLKDGDIVFVRSNGNIALVGRCISVYPGSEKVTFSGFCIRFRIENKSLDTAYLNYLFRTPSIKHAMLKGGQGANIQNINQKILSAIPIPIPPVILQSKFSSIVSAFDLTESKNLKSDAELDSLFNSISHQAFSGQL